MNKRPLRVAIIGTTKRSDYLYVRSSQPCQMKSD